MYDNLESLKNKNVSKTYDNSTDSLEALRDKLDTVDSTVTIIGGNVVLDDTYELGEDITVGKICEVLNGKAYAANLTDNSVAVVTPSYTAPKSNAVQLDATHFAVIYDTTAKHYIVVGKLTGSVVSFGTPIVLHSATSTRPSMLAKTIDNQFVVIYTDGTNVYGRVGDVSDVTITFRAAATLKAQDSTYMSIARLNNTSVIFTYGVGTGNIIYSRVGTISGATLSLGAEKTYDGGAALNWLDVCALDATTFVTSFQRGPNYYGECIVATISGTDITYAAGAWTYSTTAYVGNVSIVAISATQFVVLFSLGAATQLYLIIGTISGTAIAYGSKITVTGLDRNTGSRSNVLNVLDSTHLLISGLYATSPFGVNSQATTIATIAGANITFSTPLTFLANVASYQDMTIALSATSVITLYTKTAAITEMYAMPGTVTAYVLSYAGIKKSVTDMFMISKETGVAGETKDFLIGGVGVLSDNITSANTVGKSYKIAVTGTFTATTTLADRYITKIADKTYYLKPIWER